MLLWPACLVSLCGLASSPSQALPSQPVETTEPATSDPDVDRNVVTAFALAAQAMQATDITEAEQLLERALALLPKPGDERSMIACTLASRLYGESGTNRAYERKAVIGADECLRQRPDDPNAQMLAGMARISFGRARQGGSLLVAAIKANPALLDGQEVSGMQSIFRQLSYQNEKPRLAELRKLLLQANFGKDDPQFFGDLAIEVIADNVSRNANGEAVALLPQVMAPEYGLRLLIDRRFEPIWPMIEQWAGGNLERQRDAMLAAARGQFRIEPSLANRTVLAQALATTGHRTEAIALLGEAVDDPKLWDEGDERFFLSMLTTKYVRLLAFEDRVPEALAAAERISAANSIDRFPPIRNIMPNLAFVLIQVGRDQEALDLIKREMPPPGSLENPASFGFYAALRYCAFQRLGRKSDAAAQAALLDSSYSNNSSARTIRMACATDASTARSIWAERMADNDKAGETLLTFYRAQSGIRTIDMLQLVGTDVLIRGNEPLNAAFESFARELPASYLPALRMWDDKAVLLPAKAEPQSPAR